MKFVFNSEYWPKPIPIRNFDWCVTQDNYEPGMKMGFGATELEALKDLVEKLSDE